MHGYGVAASHAKALQLFQKAAEKGNSEAQFNLGVSYIYLHMHMHIHTCMPAYTSIYLYLYPSVSICETYLPESGGEGKLRGAILPWGELYIYCIYIYIYRHACIHIYTCLCLYPSISIYLYLPESGGKGKLGGTVQPWGELYIYCRYI